MNAKKSLRTQLADLKRYFTQITTAECAELLGITPRQVSNLAKDGKITRLWHGEYDPVSVKGYILRGAIEVLPESSFVWITSGARVPKKNEVNNIIDIKVDNSKSFLSGTKHSKQVEYLQTFAQLVEEITKDAAECGFVAKKYQRQGIEAEIFHPREWINNELVVDKMRLCFVFYITRHRQTLRRKFYKKLPPRVADALKYFNKHKYKEGKF